MTSPDSPSYRYAQRIADGLDAVEPGSEALAEQAALDSLAAVARAFRRVREGEAGTGSEVEPLFRWGPLRVEAEAGRGGNATVYRAFDPALRQPVALKLAHEADSAARLLAEGRLLARLRHPNLRAVFGAAQHEGRTGLWAEWVDGRSLAELVDELGPLSADEALGAVRQIGAALAYVHAQGVVHGDLSPANVLRERGGRVLLTDFGAGGREDDVAARAVSQGSPRWLAPERRAGLPPSRTADQWSLAALLAFLLTGKAPGDDGFEAALAARSAAWPPRLLPTLRRALSDAPGDRFAEVPAFVNDLLPVAAEPAAVSNPARRFALAAAMALAAIAAGWWLWPRAPAVPAWEADIAWLRGADEVLAADARVSLGDRLGLRLSSDQPAHVYVLNQGGEDVNLLFPLPGLDLANPLAPGSQRLPGTRAGEALHWQISVEAEAERFLVIAALDPLPGFEAMLAARGRQADLPADRRGIGQLAADPAAGALAGSELAGLLAQAQAEAHPGRLRVWQAAFAQR
jgi:eukaryotic-like serine/threonine-protein kinase